MGFNASDLLIRLLVDSKGVDKGLASAKKSLNTFGRDLRSGVLQGVGQELFRSVTGAARAAVGEIGKAIKAASDLEESVNKTGVVFGESAAEILNWSKTSATALGQSRQQALEAAASFGNLFVSMGLTQEQAADMSREMTELASDIASLNNLEPEVALEKLRAGLVGETEPLRTVGVLLNEAAVTAKAAELGFGSTTKQLTEAEKVLARYNLILAQTTTAQGDFERTAGGAANQARIFKAQMTDLRAELGTAFTPAFAEVLKGLNELIRVVRPYGTQLITQFTIGLTQAINTQIIPAIRLLRELFTYWLKPGSPPRILPEIDKWGKRAMEEYLRGWSKADFGVLENLGRSLEEVIRSFAGAGQIEETDLVSRVFGTRTAIVAAMNEFKRAGSISEATLRSIERAAGPAGSSVRSLISSYFDLETASQAAAQAQDDLTRVTEQYDAALRPINDQLEAVTNKQQDLRDQQRAAELTLTTRDPYSTASEKQIAMLELQELELRRQQRAVESERDTAIDSAQAKLDAATKEQAAKQDVYDQQAALVNQQVETNRLIEEESSLRERLASEALSAQERALRELEAAQKQLESADKERLADLERIYQAQLDYNLTIADTPGKIALLKLELGRYKEGSAEYYGILTQIASLEQSLAAQREAGAGVGGALPALEAVKTAAGETNKSVTDLADAIEGMFAAITGTGDNVPDWVKVAQGKPLGGTGGGLSAYMTDSIDAVKELTEAMNGFLKYLGFFFPEVEGKAETSSATITALEQNQQAQSLNYLRTFTALFNGDWGAFWAGLVEASRLGSEENRLAVEAGLIATHTTMGERLAEWSKTMGQWFTDQSTAIATWGEGLRDAGASAIANFWEGLSDYWDTVIVPGWLAKTQWLRDLLPGSEPKNPASPLRDLGDAGAALVANLMRGMENATLSITPQMGGALTAAGAATAGVTNLNVSVNLTGGGATYEAGREVGRGVVAELRARGLA